MKLKVGDKVRVLVLDPSSGCIDPEGDFYWVGDVGVIVQEHDWDGDFYVDFNDQGNPKVDGDGRWWVRPNQVEILEEA